MHPRLRLSEELSRIAKLCDRPHLTFGDLLQNVEHRSHAMLALILALPFLFPFPLMGLSIPIGLILTLVGAKKAFGHAPWLPSWLWKKQIPNQLFVKIFTAGAKLFRRFEKVVKPRGRWIENNPLVRAINGSLIAACGCLLALPLPPGTNFPPALCIILISIGVLEHDAVCLVLGYVVFAANLALFSAILFFGVQGVQWLSKYSEFMQKF